jgi:hypothetical protein
MRFTGVPGCAAGIRCLLQVVEHLSIPANPVSGSLSLALLKLETFSFSSETSVFRVSMKNQRICNSLFKLGYQTLFLSANHL